MSLQTTQSRALLHFPPALRSLIASPAQDSLHLVLETAGARSTWLTHRYASAALEHHHKASHVLLATWSYGVQFWKQELRKSANVDVDKLIQSKRLTVVDCDDALSSCSENTSRKVAETWHSLLTATLRALPSQQDTLLILDSPDLLMGTELVPANTLLSLIMDIRTQVRNTVILTSSNIFATSAGSLAPSPLQSQQQHFLMSLIHQADYVLATRVLDTGQASDVSGALRVTRGGQVSNEAEDAQAIDTEFLYFVDASRAARVWQRGSGT